MDREIKRSAPIPIPASGSATEEGEKREDYLVTIGSPPHKNQRNKNANHRSSEDKCPKSIIPFSSTDSLELNVPVKVSAKKGLLTEIFEKERADEEKHNARNKETGREDISYQEYLRRLDMTTTTNSVARNSAAPFLSGTSNQKGGRSN